MTAGPRQVPVPVAEELRASARRQARTLSGGAVALLAIGFAAILVIGFMVLDYRFNQYPHRLVKILIGATAGATILILPHLGLMVIPIANPFIPVLPLIPIPGLNPVNVLFFATFAIWALGRVLNREPVFRSGRVGWLLLSFTGLAALSIGRGAAIPTGFEYDVPVAIRELFRAATSFFTYFMCLAMLRGERDRHTMGWMVVLGLLAESMATFVWRGNGTHGRSQGTIDQPNELGAFLSIFVVFAAALLPAVKGWIARGTLLAAVGLGAFGVFLSLSRGAILALAAGALFLAMRSSRWMAVLLGLALLTSPIWLPQNVKDRMSSTHVEVEGSDEVAIEGSTQSRFETWQSVLAVISDHPLDGVGFTGLAYVLPAAGEAMGLEEVKDSAHNTFLRCLAELGVIGFGLFVYILWRCMRTGLSVQKRGPTQFDRQMGLGLAASTLVLAICCFFGDRFFPLVITGNFWICAALVEHAFLEQKGRAT